MARELMRFSLLVGLLLLPATAWASSGGTVERVDRARSIVDGVAQQASGLEAAFLGEARQDRSRTLASRFAEGEALFALEDWEAAAVLLIGPVEDPAFRSDPRWARARWMLAESFYQLRNHALAQGYFRDILGDAGDHSVDASQRLLDIALETRRFDGLAERYRALVERAPQHLDDGLRMTLGKALYFQGEWSEALLSFSQVSRTGQEAHSAAYWEGVVLARLERMSEARDVFEGLVERLDPMMDDAPREKVALRDLAIMAAARVRFEEGEFAEALTLYQRIPSRSTLFANALFERAWAHAQMGDADRAINMLERLSVVTRDPVLGPESALVRGELLVQQERFAEAVGAFEDMDARYAPIDRAIRRFMEDLRASNDPLAALLDPEQGAARMPAEVRPWLESDRSVMGFLRVLDRAAALERDLLESQELVLQLRSALESHGSVRFNPWLQAGMGRAFDLRNTIVRIYGDLLAVEADVVLRSVPASARLQYRDLEAERHELARQFFAIPQTFDAILGRESEVFESLQSLEMLLHDVEIERARQQEQASELRSLLEGRRRDGGLSVEVMDGLIAESVAVERSFRQLEGQARTLRTSLREVRASVGIGDAVHASEQEVVVAYREALAAEARWLAERRGTEHRDLFAAIDRERARLATADRQIAAFLTAAEGVGDSQRAMLRQLLAQEEANLTTLERQVAAMNAGAGQTVARAAIEALTAVEEGFREVLLRANLGILDVAWQRQESTAAEIRRVQQSRSRDRDQLESDFVEILGRE